MGLRVLAVTNMYPSDGAPASGVFVEQQIEGLRRVGVDVRLLNVDRTKGAWIYSQVPPRIREEIDEFRPEIVHVMYGGVMADLVTRQKDLPPVVVTFHGSDLLGENLSGTIRKWISHFGVNCSKRAARRASRVVVVNRKLISVLPEATRDKVRVIPCGIDLERFKPMDQRACQQKLGWDGERFHVLFANGNKNPVKRPWLASSAVQQLKQQGVPAELHEMSSVPNTDVPVWLNACGALLLTSDHEGSPTIVKEALACEKPIVSVDVGDVAERLVNLPFCRVTDPDPTALAEALKQVSKMAREDCRMASLEDLSHLAVARQLHRLYEETIAGSIRTAQPLPPRTDPVDMLSAPGK